MLRSFFFIFAALGSLFLSACTTLNVSVPGPRIFAPQVLQDGKMNIDLSSVPAKNFVVTYDASSRPPVIDDEISSRSTSLLQGGLNLGLSDKLEVGAFATNEFGLGGHAQYMILGEPSSKKTIGFLSSLRFDAYHCTRLIGGNQKGLFGPGGYPWNARVALDSVGGGFSVGYRARPELTYFTSASFNYNTIWSQISQDANSSAGDSGGVYSHQSFAQAYALGLGLQFEVSNLAITPTIQSVDSIFSSNRTHDNLIGVTLSIY